MPNSFITLQEIARQALPRLMENMVFPDLVNKDFSNEFSRNLGDKIQIRKPVILEAAEFNASTGVTAQGITESSIEVQLDKIATVDIEVSALEGALNISDLNRQFIEPAAVALAQKINSDGLALYKDIPYISGTAGTTPSALADIAAVRKVLNGNKVPLTPRNAVWDVNADANFTTIDAIVNAEKSGSTDALRNGSIGRLFGLENYMSQAVKTHTKGTLAVGGGTNPKIYPKAITVAGDKQLTLSVSGGSSPTLTGTLVVGDIITIKSKTYTITELATADANEVVAKVYPALPVLATTDEVTLLASHTANLAFNPMAFTFVTRPLVAPSGVESYVTSFNGLSLRVTKGYDMKYKKEMMSMDVLYAYETIYPELAVRILG